MCAVLSARLSSQSAAWVPLLEAADPSGSDSCGSEKGGTCPLGQYRLLQTDQAGHMEMSPCCTQGYVLALWGKTGRRHGAGLSD